MATKLILVWNRDKPRYELTLKGFSITRSSEQECLQVAVEALERSLSDTKKLLDAHRPNWGTTRIEDGQVIDLGNDGPPPVTCPNECAYCGEPCEGEYCSEEHAEHRSMY
jgi:hypothetical protein